jgi:uncharacterized membrane protein YqaE (UPF0057 family)
MKKIFTRALLLVLTLAFFSPSTWAISIVNPTPTHGEPDPATVQAALADFRNLSKAEKRERFRAVKAEIKAFKAARSAHADNGTSTLLQVIITILIPPLGVFLHEGVINSKFWIDLILTLIFYIPGLIYGLIVVLGSPSNTR